MQWEKHFVPHCLSSKKAPNNKLQPVSRPKTKRALKLEGNCQGTDHLQFILSVSLCFSTRSFSLSLLTSNNTTKNSWSEHAVIIYILVSNIWTEFCQCSPAELNKIVIELKYPGNFVVSFMFLHSSCSYTWAKKQASKGPLTPNFAPIPRFQRDYKVWHNNTTQISGKKTSRWDNLNQKKMKNNKCNSVT